MICCSHELIPEKDKDREPTNFQLSPDVTEVRTWEGWNSCICRLTIFIKSQVETILQLRVRVTEIRVRDVVVSELSAINQVKFPFNLIKAFKWLIFLKITMMLWTTTANDRKVLERLEKGLLAPKNGDLSLEEAPWAVLRLVGVPTHLLFQKQVRREPVSAQPRLVSQLWRPMITKYYQGPKARRAIGYSSYNPGPTRATLSWKKVSLVARFPESRAIQLNLTIQKPFMIRKINPSISIQSSLILNLNKKMKKFQKDLNLNVPFVKRRFLIMNLTWSMKRSTI